MDKIELDKLDEVHFQIKNIDRSTALELREHFSCFVDNYFFHPKYRAKLWDGRISFYDWASQTIPIGLFPQFVKFCHQFGYEYQANFGRDEILNDISDDEFEEYYQAIFKNEDISPRDYQDECIKKALRMKRGIIESPTGSGKSLVIYSIIRFILGIAKGKILLIVPNVSLVNQMFSDFQDYGWEHTETYCSLIFSGSKKVNPECPIVISTWQSIYKRGSSFFDQFQAVIVDETHGAKSNSIQTCLKKCVNAEYRIGLTGTMPEELHNQYTIFGYLGPRIFEMKSSELIEIGVLSKIRIANLMLEYPKETVHRYWHNEDGKMQKNTYQEELDVIYGSLDRNKIFKYIIDKLKKEENILILCHRISHLKDIKDYLEKNFPDRHIYEIYGKTEAEEREKIRKLTDIQGSTIILGTFATMSTGINIKRLHHVIFASSYRSKIKVLQSIGRGLRTHETKDKLIVWDIVDDLTWVHTWGDKEVLHKNHVYNHWMNRLEYYDKQGFQYLTKKININSYDI